MVKADVKIDYYAALGLGPSAEVDEIKKQFRKLALKFHPDRNPGKEIEVNSKFQAIQAAHEILTDPHQRLKYDTDRLRAGYGRVSGPPRPRQHAGYSHFPTSASQNKPSYGYDHRGRPTQSTPYAQPPPSAGAQKYTGYARAGAAKWDKTPDDARTRADAYRGFQDMKNSRQAPRGWFHFDPHTGEPAGHGERSERSEGTTGARSHAQRPQSAYEAFFGKQPSSGPQKAQKAKKRDGFTPWTPGEDEPMAKNTSAYVHNSSKREQSQGYFEAAPSPTAKKSAEREPAMPNLERTSSRYAGVGGEKTRVSGHSSGHSKKNARNSSPAGSDSRSHTNPTSPTSPQPDSQARPRSASPKIKPRHKEPLGSPSPASTSSSDSDEVLPNFRPQAVPRSRKSAGPPKCTKHPNFNKNNYGVAFDSDSWLLDEPTGLPRSRKPGNRSENWDWNANDEWPDLDNRTSQPFQNPFAAGGKGFFRGNMQAKAGTDSVYDGSQWSDGGVKTKTSPASNGVAPEGEIPTHSQDSSNKPRNKSDVSFGTFIGESITKSMTGSNKREQFQFGGTPGGKTAERTTQKTAARHDSRTHPPASSGRFGEHGPSHVPEADSSKPTEAKPTFSQAQFSADQWQDMLNTNTWSMPPPGAQQQQQQTESRRQRSPKKQPKAVPKGSEVPQHAKVSTEAEETEVTFSPQASVDTKHKPSSGEERMDVDEDTSATGPQNIPKAPHQTTGKEQVTTAKSASKPSFLDLKNLESVSPFTATSGGGINDLQDLNSTLPFDSKPANSPQAGINIRPRDLALPKPPKPPSAPTLSPAASQPGAPPELALARTAWDRYIAEMGTYMFEWNDFNRKMLGHFNARQAIVETGLSPNWMKAVGDTSRLNFNDGSGPSDDEQLVLGQAKGGFGAYLRGVEEDFVVREHWSVAWERHRECILVLGRVREWIRRGGKIH